MRASTNHSHRVEQQDYDLHGIVGIRLCNATAHDIAAVNRQLGPIQAPLQRKPDITVQFVDRLPLSSPIRYLGVNDAGFTDDAFLVLRSKHKSQAKVQIPFEQVGQPCTITCESGLPAVPLLIAIINLTALAKGALPMHAAAFAYKGQGVLTTGWAKGGKTETLLAFMANGAKYIGDEWVYINQDGTEMRGIPEPIRLWYWHLQSMPQYWPLVGQSDRVRLRLLRLMAQTMEHTPSNKHADRFTPIKLAKRVTPLVKQQLHVQLPPEKLFGVACSQAAGTLDKVFFVGSHAASEVTVKPIDPQEVAKRMVYSLQEERQEFLSFYHKFRFAFPDLKNELIEGAETRQHLLLTQMLADKETYAVYHPYPFAIPLLFDALSPLF